MSDIWPEVSLAEVADDITVGHVGPMAHQYVAKGIPFLRSLNVEPFRINRDSLMFIDVDFHRSLRKSALRPGDVVIVRTGKPGACAVVPHWLDEANCSDLVIVRPGPRVRPSYVAYVVNSIAAHHISSHIVGAVQQHFNVGSARQLRFPLPSLVEQDRVASLLDALDDKIDLNRRMNETLEAMARAIFKDWFVDFGPVRAKAEGRQPPGLTPDIAALFPDTLDGEDKPVGWQISTIGDEVRVVGGTTPRTSEPKFWDGDIAWATPKDLSALRAPVLWETERRITPAGLAQIGSGLLPAGTVLLSSRAPIGYLAIAQTPVAVNQGFVAMVCEGKLSNTFCLFWTEANMDAIKQRANGSTFMEISKANFRPIPVVVPSAAVAAAFDHIARPLLDRIATNEQESHTLAALRDLLLPKLMSGELRIRDAKKAVEAAA